MAQAFQIAFAAVLGAAVLVATFGGGSVLLTHHAPAVVEGWQSRSWPGTPAVVRRSEAIHKYSPSGWSRGGTGTHVVEVAYVYTVHDRLHEGSRRSLDDVGKVLSAEFAQKAADRLPEGSIVTAYYDPADPGQSLLKRGVPVGGVIGTVFGLALIATGTLPFILGWRIRAHLARRRAQRRI